MTKSAHEQNRASWNAATVAHNSHKKDQAKFLREGGSTLKREERELLAPLQGKKLVHLQCNCGQDSLSLAQLGASVTGVDISDKAIEFARQLSEESKIPATFERSDLFDWFAQARAEHRKYDRVFSSYGVLGWLSDLKPWAKGIKSILAPDGRFVLMEFHSQLWTMDENGQPDCSYFDSGEIPSSEGVVDYVASSGPPLAPSGFEEGIQEFKNPEPTVEFNYNIGHVVTALAQAGLAIEDLREYPHCNGYRPTKLHIEKEPGVFVPGPELISHPLMFSVVATHR